MAISFDQQVGYAAAGLHFNSFGWFLVVVLVLVLSCCCLAGLAYACNGALGWCRGCRHRGHSRDEPTTTRTRPQAPAPEGRGRRWRRYRFSLIPRRESGDQEAGDEAV